MKALAKIWSLAATIAVVGMFNFSLHAQDEGDTCKADPGCEDGIDCWKKVEVVFGDETVTDENENVILTIAWADIHLDPDRENMVAVDVADCWILQLCVDSGRSGPAEYLIVGPRIDIFIVSHLTAVSWKLTRSPDCGAPAPEEDCLWCSPGFWRNHHTEIQQLTGIDPDTTYYNDEFDPDLPGNPTLKEVLACPQIYGGDAINNVADLLTAAALGADACRDGRNAENPICPLESEVGRATPLKCK